MHRNWNDLQYIIAVSKHGSLSAAARKLNVNHATVLRHVAAFESRTGVTLFERRNNRYSPTSDCLGIMERLTQLEHSVRELDTAIKNIGSPFVGRVGITSTDTICQLILPRHIRRLNEFHPELEIELSSTNSRLDLTQLDAEITIRPTSSLPANLIGKRACNISLEIYGSLDYVELNPSSDMKDHCWLCFIDPPKPTAIVEWEKDRKLPNVVFRSDSFLSLSKVAESGLGLAMIPSFVGNESPHLVRALQFADRLTYEIQIATHKDRAGSERMQALTDFFYEAIMTDKDMLEGII